MIHLGDPRLPERFWAKVMADLEAGCWVWTASGDGKGYGKIWSSQAGRLLYAHRVAYEALIGPVPDGLSLDHRLHNGDQPRCVGRACCNPEHLEPVTHAVNVARGRLGEASRRRLLAKTHCKRGHPLSGDNVYLTRGDGRRQCRACRRERQRNAS